MKKAKILVVDDERSIAQMVKIILQKEGISDIDICFSYKEALNYIEEKDYNLYLLDVMLPDGEGTSLADIIRKRSDAPLFFLTAKTTDADKLTGFIHGADDYITKPFNPLELAARVKVQLNRYLDKQQTKNIYDFGIFKLDLESAELIINEQRISLTEKQYHLLTLFCEHPNQVISKEQIYESVWGYDTFVNDNTIMVHMSKLREKIEPDPAQPKVIVTVRGLGYKLVAKEVGE